MAAARDLWAASRVMLRASGRNRHLEWLQCALLTCTILLIPALARAQDVTFTRITTGAIVKRIGRIRAILRPQFR